MQYRIHKINGYLHLECLDGGTGSQKPRCVRGSRGVAPLTLLDRLLSRGHLNYHLEYAGVRLTHVNDLDSLMNDDDTDIDKLAIVITSSHDVLSLCARGWNALEYPRDMRSVQQQARYKRPTSKKEVKGSWLYQNATEAA